MTRTLNATEKAYCAEVAGRIKRGNAEFERTLIELGGIAAEAAALAREWMSKKKLTKRDFMTGRITVKHGAYLDRDVIGRIAAEAAK